MRGLETGGMEILVFVFRKRVWGYSMQTINTQIATLDPGLAILLILAGLIYGLFGWRMVRFLVVLDAVVLALLLAYGLCGNENGSGLSLSRLPIAFPILIALPYLAWRCPERAMFSFFGLIGFFSAQLFLIDFSLPLATSVAVGAVGAGLAVALGKTLFAQTTVVMTGLHGAWLVVGALALVAANSDNMIGRTLSSLNESFSLLFPVAALVFSAILITIQWTDLDKSAGPLLAEQ
ncbi:MAG: hypothetical protein ACE5EQ_00265 [Phycisphaerae bacterium]